MGINDDRCRELERERDEARAFLRRTATTGGSIVSSAAMTPTQIAGAMAADRMLVMPDGCGFVYVPDSEVGSGVALAAERAKVAKLERDRDARIAMDRIIIRERDEARAERRVAHAGVEDVWFWEDSPADDPESLSCPVVMPAERLRRFVAAERERDEARSRVAELEALAEELMGERDEARSKLEQARTAQAKTLDALNEANASLATLLAQRSELRAKAERCDRYEAQGPAVLIAKHAEDCYVTPWERGLPIKNKNTEERVCDCGRSMREEAYREQHARDVAIVEAVDLAKVTPVDNPDVPSRTLVVIAKGAVLRALKGGA